MLKKGVAAKSILLHATPPKCRVLKLADEWRRGVACSIISTPPANFRSRMVSGLFLRSIFFTLLLSVFVFAFLSVSSEPVTAVQGCCIKDRGGCETVFDASECDATQPGTRFESGKACSDASLANQCSIGCCLIGARKDAKYKVECGAGSGQFIQGTEKPFAVMGSPGTANLCPAEAGAACRTDAECPAGTRCNPLMGICAEPRAPAPNICSNGIKDEKETDIDCGPPDSGCAPCPEGKTCEQNTDCTPGFECKDGACQEIVLVCDRDGVIDSGEECDTGPTGVIFADPAKRCQDFQTDYRGRRAAYSGGQLTCDASCKVSTRSCTFTPPEARRESPTGRCGDGNVDAPNQEYVIEQCEESLSPADLVQACGAGASCNDCQCVYACERDPGTLNVLPPTLDPNRGDRVQLRFSYARGDNPLSCGLQGFQIYRCDNTAGSPTEGCNIPPERLIQHQIKYLPVDSVLLQLQRGDPIVVEDQGEEKREYCYKVGAVLQGSTLVEPTDDDTWQCLKTADPFCAGKEGNTFCSPDNAREIFTCRENSFQLSGTCGANQYCSQSTPRLAECKDQDPCEVCNGLFRIYGALLVNRPFTEGAQRAVCERLTSCTYDYTKTSVDQFQQCSEIRNCYDYKSKYACENDQNHCKVGLGGNAGGGCSWFDTIPELGIGVCTPKERTFSKCELCNNPELFGDQPGNQKVNQVFAGCNANICASFGGGESPENQCYFATRGHQAGPGEGGSCQASTELGCNNYGSDKASCIGPPGAEQAAVVHIGQGQGNRINPRSNDRFNYGTCKFGDVGAGPELCFKEADGDGLPDCGSDDAVCIQDNKPPVTAISTEEKNFENGRLLVGKKLSIPVSVDEQATTFFCIGNPAGGCYPGEDDVAICKMQELLQQEFNKEPKELRFFSKDIHKNLEVISPDHTIPLIIDTSAPVRTNPDTPLLSSTNRILTMNLGFEEEVTCDARVTDLNGREIKADDTPEARLQSNAIQKKKGMVFERKFYNLKDGLYIFTYECEDKFGNVAKGGEAHSISFDGVKITSPQYHVQDNNQYTLAVQVEGNQQCKFTNQGDTLQFSPTSMDQMDGSLQAGVSPQEQQAAVSLQPGLNVIQVACSGLEGNEGGQANSANRAIVVFDQEPPRLEMYNSIDGEIFFDDTEQYGSIQPLFVGCHDDAIYRRYNLKHLGLGCKEVGFRLQKAGTTGTFTFENSGLEIAGPILVKPNPTNSEHVSVTGTDGHNTGNKDLTVGLAPTPTLDLAITDDFGTVLSTEGTTPILGPQRYRVKIRSNGVIKKEAGVPALTSLIEVSSEDDPTFSAQTQLVNCEGELNEYECTLDLRGVAQQGEAAGLTTFNVVLTVTATVKQTGPQCFPGEFEVQEQEISLEGKTFVLFNREPGVDFEPIFGPGRSPGILELLENQIFQYPVHFEEGVYYTNQPKLFATGRVLAPDLTKRIEFYTGPCIVGDHGGALKKQAQDFVVTPVAEQGGEDEIEVLPAPQGATELITLSEGNFAGNFLRFENVDPRISYGNYHQFYKIGEQETIQDGPQRGRIKLRLTAPLEAPLEGVDADGNPVASIKAFVRPPNRGNQDDADDFWFGQNLSLQNGCNRFYAKAIGSTIEFEGGLAEFTGPPTPIQPAQIIVDTVGPRIVSKSPDVGTTKIQTNEIVVVVEEEASDAELIKDTIAMRLSNVTITEEGEIQIVNDVCAPGTRNTCALEIEESFANGIRRYTITYRGGKDRQGAPFDGSFCVDLQGRDKATNRFSPTPQWCFGVNDRAPDEPVWKVVDGVEHEGIVYTRTKPVFELDYTRTSEKVELTQMMYRVPDGAGFGGFDQQPVACQLKEEAVEVEEKRMIDEEPRPIVDGKVKNVFICILTTDLLPEEMNRGYVFLARAKRVFDDGTASPEAMHPSPVVVIDNQKPQVVSFYHKPVAASRQEVPIELIVRDAGYPLQARLAYITDSGMEQADLELQEHEQGDDRYVFVWRVPEFDITRKDEIEKKNRLDITLSDFAGNEPTIVASEIFIDLSPPDIYGLKFEVQAPYQERDRKQYTTRQREVRINGSFTDFDIYPDGFIYLEPGDHLREEIYDVRKDAMLRPERTFETQLKIRGIDNRVVRQPYTLFIEDASGQRRGVEFMIITDLEPPRPGRVVVN